MAEWGFYGRERELKELLDRVSGPVGRAVAVLGTRRVGKTKLLERCAAALPRNKPMVVYELPAEAHLMDEGLHEALDAACLRGILDDMPPVEFYSDLLNADDKAGIRFRKRVKHLIGKGAVVALDEFHHATAHGLEGGIKLMIDRFFHTTMGPAPPGSLVVCGSHQQKMLRMLQADRPLYGRFNGDKIWLRQLQAPAVLQMAAEHGWLARPERLLTLYSVNGGRPDLWRRFHGDPERQANCAREPDEGAWRDGFRRFERDWLADPENKDECYNSKADRHLHDDARGILLHLAAEGRWRGSDLNSLRGKLPKGATKAEWICRIDRQLPVLTDHLEMVGKTPSGSGGKAKYRIIDPYTLFQLILEVGGADREAGDELPRKVAGHLNTAEGYALERFTAEWLLELGRHRPGEVVQNVDRRGVGEIDVVAFTWAHPSRPRSDPDAVYRRELAALDLASCKRDPAKHDPEEDAARFQAYLNARRPEAGPKGLASRRMAVSPDMSGVDAGRFRAHGVECMDFGLMAQELGIDPDQ